MTTPTLSRTGHPRGGRPAKVPNGKRWHLIVDPAVRAAAETRAAAEGRDLTDVLRSFMAEYAAGTPRSHGA